MQIVTVSGFKGGTGKTTLATLLGVAATLDGLRVAGLDLDPNTRNFASILVRRRAAGLPAPDHVAMLDSETTASGTLSGRLSGLVRMARTAGYDLLIIDTGSGSRLDLVEAHALADVILTPMNDSPADMHGLFKSSRSPQALKVNYRDLVEAIRFERRERGLPVPRWHICRNRVSALPTRIGGLIRQAVDKLAHEAGFDAVWCIGDRVTHRSIGLDGRTVLDPPHGRNLTMSELAGRSEVRAILGLLAREADRFAA